MAGSLGYAERLSYHEDLGGSLGDPELREASPNLLAAKVDQLASLIEGSRSTGGVVVHTGAGISTSTGIPDFRGPKGIWTLQRKGQPLPKASVPFDRARPSLTHMALVGLQRHGFIRYLVSCNVDCLHIRSGYPREEMAELHGNGFAERCEKCDAEYVRDFEMPSIGFKVTAGWSWSSYDSPNNSPPQQLYAPPPSLDTRHPPFQRRLSHHTTNVRPYREHVYTTRSKARLRRRAVNNNDIMIKKKR